jgi:hypothetical protein
MSRFSASFLTDSLLSPLISSTTSFCLSVSSSIAPPIVPPILQVQVKEEVYNINDKLLSEIEISDVEDNLKKYFEIAKNFQELFIRNLTDKSISAVTQKNAKFKNYVTPIRLMIENNECTLQDLRDVWSYLSSPKSEFWKKNILSTTKLREQIVKLIFETKKQ